MAIVIDGSNAAGTVNLGTNGTISNLAVGGVPDGTIDTDALAANAVTSAKTTLSVNSSLAVTTQTSALSGATNYDLTFPANCFQVDFNAWEVSTSGSGNPGFYLGDSNGFVTSGSKYNYTQAKYGAASAGSNIFAGNAANAIYVGDHLGSATGDHYYLHMKFRRCGSANKWTFECLATEYESNVLQAVQGYLDSSNIVTQARFAPIGTGWDAGQFSWVAWSTA